MKKILIGSNFKREGFAMLEGKFQLIYPQNERFTRHELLAILPDVDVLILNFSVQIDREIIDAGKQLKLIANFGVGYNNIDVDYATQKNIAVANTPKSVLEPTAELCFAILMATARRIGFYNTKMHAGERIGWGLYDELGLPVYGKTLGIYGMGRIGQAVARRAVASGMKIIYHNRKPLSEDIEKIYNARYVDFDTLLSQSDFVSLNAPATADTYHLMGEAEFKKMKKTAILINTARGALVHEKALIEALTNNEIFAAGLDVFENEPKISPELFAFENVLLTPHVGTQTDEGRLDMQHEVAENILHFFEGGVVERVN